jgi:membrane associated rhomboid family serine protease
MNAGNVSLQGFERLPLNDRDYMRRPPAREPRYYRVSSGFGLNPVLALIIANVMLYIAVLVSGEGRYPFGPVGEVIGDRFTYYLGLIPYYFPERPWTIVTSMFIHAGFFHLLGNMLILFFFGTFLLRMVGSGRFLLVYFVGGIVGNALYLLLGDSLSIAVGASGAIYAIAGALVALVPRVRVLLWFFFPMPLWVVVLVFFVLWSFIPGVAWQAHIGGLALGLIAGYFFRRRLRGIYLR